MQNTNSHIDIGPSGADFLPDFCSGPNVFIVLFITELVAILLTLAVAEVGPDIWQNLLWLSIYLQWIGLCSAAGLCLLRRALADKPGKIVAVLAYVLLISITGLIAHVTYYVTSTYGLPLAYEMTHSEFVIRSLGVSTVVSAMTLRYFWVQRQWRRETLATGQARYELLEARIRPHFLFNSLNSIAELTMTQPQAAETAVEDLATLFRANLNQGNQKVSLREELSLTEAYLRMEKLRLGDRLSIEWQLDEPLGGFSIPPLILQPLLENAVRHGIEQRSEGGCIRLSVRTQAEQIQVELENPVGDSSNSGTGEALKNIRQRLHWLYGDSAELKIQTDNKQFLVQLRLPAEDVSL